MKISKFLIKVIILFFAFNLALYQPILALDGPTPPTPPTAPTAPTAPNPPPSPPPPPTPPTPPTAPGTAPESSSQPTQTNEASNTATGANSDNQSSVNNTETTQVDNQNQGQVDNDISSQTNTGGNSASYNTGGGQILTGDANQSLTVYTNLNQNTTLSADGGLSINNQANNLLTGSDSENNSNLNNSLNNTLNNNNNGSLTNKISLDSISGQNTSSGNTGTALVKTGNASADLALVSAVNTNVTGTGGIKTFNVYDTQTGDIVFKVDDFSNNNEFQNGNPQGAYQQTDKAVVDNSITGADSTNNSSVNNTTDQSVDNKNQAVLKNDITINAVTGENNTSDNTGKGDIQTGDAKAVASLVNFLNTNLVVDEWMIGVVNVFGTLVGDIVLPASPTGGPAGETGSTGSNTSNGGNSVTGADSSNNSQTTNTTSDSFTNYNNAEVLNNIETTAVTGANTASYNTGPGLVQDGNATVNTSAVTVANSNVQDDGGTLWLVLVNKMGQWVGQIIGEPQGQTTAGNLVQTSNQLTGPESSNSSQLTNQNSTSVTNNNNGKIENNINIVAKTGENAGSYNTLGGDIQAGDANIAVSLVNFVNTNLKGKKLMIAIVNVFGEWIGDVIPPDQNKNTKDDQLPDPDIGGNLPPDVVVQEDKPSPDKVEPAVVYNYPDTENNTPDNTVDGSIKYGTSFTPYDLTYADGGWDTYQKPATYKRGFFFSTAFAASDSAQETADNRITSDWLYFLIPSLFGVVIGKNKKIRTMLFSYL